MGRGYSALSWISDSLHLERSNLLLARFRGATSWVPTYGSERPLDRVASFDVTQDMLVALKMMRVDVDIRMMRSP